jgi:tetratricopeptide (TPR) repeat protein
MFNSAFFSSDFLARNLRRQVKQGNMTLLEPLIDALNLAGHTVSIAKNNPEQALLYYRRMEYYIRQLDTRHESRPTLLSLARTYQGEMRRRRGDIANAIQAFKDAPQDPLVETLVRGNRAQLLARAYAAQGDFDEAKRQLDRSSDLLGEVQKGESGLYVCYNSCSTYIEYARFYLQKNNLRESLTQIEHAEQHVSLAPRWRIPVLINKGRLLLHKAPRNSFAMGLARGDEFQEGMRLLEEAIELAQKAGHQRQLSRIASIRSNLFSQGKEYMDAVFRLDEKLTRNIID